MSGDGIKTIRKSKTMWFAALLAGLGAADTVAGGTITAALGPIYTLGVPVLVAVLRQMTAGGVKVS